MDVDLEDSVLTNSKPVIKAPTNRMWKTSFIFVLVFLFDHYTLFTSIIIKYWRSF
jgi:hypothetical protein